MFIILEIFIILLLIILNGIFSMSEIALVSARKNRLEQQAESGNRGAQAALRLTENPNRFLSIVQIGITLIGILNGALGGATISDPLATAMSALPVIGPYSHAIAFAIVVVGITYLSLVIGELVPKRIGLNYAERIAIRLSPMMDTLARINTPIVKLLTASTNFVLRLLHVGKPPEIAVTEADVRDMIEQGTEVGVFNQVEEEMVKRVFQLGDRRASTVMTYRTDIVWLNLEDPLAENLRIIQESGHSRYPVAEGDLEETVGILLAKDLLAQELENQPINLRELLNPPFFLPEALTILQVLERMRTERIQIALLIDEYGSITGLITVTDVLESIVGELPAAEEHYEPAAVQRENGSWLFDGSIPIDDVKGILHLDTLPGEQEAGFETLGGFMMAQLGRIPKSGDHFEWDGWEFEVVDMDGHRVDKVLASPVVQQLAE